jgi:hypothetical protein
MLDANAIMMQVGAGTAPSTWRVLPARTGFFIGGAATFGVAGLAALGFIAYLIIGGHIFYYGAAPTDAQGEQTWQIIDVVVSLAVAALFLGVSIMRLVGLGSVSQQMLVLLPEGFVVSTSKGAQSYSFANMNGISGTAARDGSVTLSMRRADNGKQMRFALDGRYGTPKTIAGSIMAAQGQYATARAQAGQMRPPQR